MTKDQARKGWQITKVSFGYVLGFVAGGYILYTAWGNTFVTLLCVFGGIAGWIVSNRVGPAYNIDLVE